MITVDDLPNGTTEYLNDISGVSSVSVDETTIRVSCTSGSETTILRALEESDAKVVNFATEGTSLEDLFIEYTTDKRQIESETPMTTGSDTEVER